MIAGCAAHAAAGLISAHVYLPRPFRLRETVNQALAILLLILGAKRGLCLSAVVACANAVLLIMRVLRRQVAVVARTWRNFDSPGVVGIWLT